MRPMQLKNLLLTTDFSDLARTAYGAAAALAKRYEARLHLVHAEQPLPAIYGVPFEKLRPEFLKDLQQEASHPALKGLEVESHLLYDAAPFEKILDLCREAAMDLIVMATHGRSSLGHLFLGSYTERVVRLATVPVLTCRKKEGLEPSSFPRSVLVPFDFSDNARAVFPTANFLGKHQGVEFTFLKVFPALDEFFYHRYPTQKLVEEWRELTKRETVLAAEEFSKLREKELPALRATFESRDGDPNKEIIKRAEELQSDLILMATHGWTGVKRFFLGSVAEKIVRTAPCSVWTVRPEEASTAADSGSAQHASMGSA